ncbi:MAG: hypothetical protein QM786_18530 [Breznakibacter sp.]
MKKKLVFTFLFYMGIVSGWAQTNLVENWDGNGDNVTTSSFPNNYGWDVTVGTFNYANSTSGVRWSDVTSGHTLNGTTYIGRLLMVRWDGSGNTSLASVYSYPVTLEANKKYKFTWIYEWWNNASVPTYTVGIDSGKTGTSPIASKSFICSSTRNQLQQGEMSFFNTSAGTFYLTITANNLAVLGGIGELSIVEVPSVLECDEASVSLNYFESEKTISITPNGSNNPISLIAPEGINLSTNILAHSGGKVTVSSADSSAVMAQITVTQGTDVLGIPVSASFPEKFP